MILLGIDPGTATVGYGVVECAIAPGAKKFMRHQDHGVISTSKDLAMHERLHQIHRELTTLIRIWKPVALAVENIYFFKNAKTVIPVSQAKGVIMLCAAQKKLPVFEITPPQVKTAITGYGKADKKQMQRMIQELLNLAELPRPDDAADALGIAMSCSMLYRNELL